MKGGREHRVPLSPASVETLEAVRELHSPAGLCFPSPARAGKAIAASSMAQALKAIYGDRCTVHGFRSSFRDWASEQTSVPHAVAEAALAHQVGSDVERSYARSDLFEKRRDLMDRWAEFATEETGKLIRDHAVRRGHSDSKSRSAISPAVSSNRLRRPLLSVPYQRMPRPRAPSRRLRPSAGGDRGRPARRSAPLPCGT